MTEAEWLASEGPAAMLRLMGGEVTWRSSTPKPEIAKPSDRKLRLFAVACRLQVYGNLGEYEVVDQSDGLTDPHGGSAYSMAEVWCRYITSEDTRAALAHRANLLRDIVGNPFRPVTLPPCDRCSGDGLAHGSDRPFEWTGPGTHPGPCPKCEGRKSPLVTPAVASLAQAAYDGRDPVTGHMDPLTLAAVADALEEAGCDNDDMLLHLRGYRPCPNCVAIISPMSRGGLWPCIDCGAPDWQRHGWVPGAGPHVRGFWVIDLLTGREGANGRLR